MAVLEPMHLHPILECQRPLSAGGNAILADFSYFTANSGSTVGHSSTPHTTPPN
jgi:hypothetical protein